MNKYDVPYADPTTEQQAKFATKHGLGGEWTRLGPAGQVHAVFRVGNVVVRIPRAHPHWIDDTLTEAVALPAVVAAGVPTPKLVVFDDDRDVFDVPVLVAEYFPGRPVDSSIDPLELCRWLGRTLASMHENVSEVPDPNAWLDKIEMERCREELEACVRCDAIDVGESLLVEGLIGQIEGLMDIDATRVFVHNDVHVNNILVGESGFALIDWGDAGWGDPSYDFMTLPPEWVVPVAQSYLESRPLGLGFGARVAWNQLGQALRRVQGQDSRRHLGNARLLQLATHLEQILSIGS